MDKGTLQFQLTFKVFEMPVNTFMDFCKALGAVDKNFKNGIGCHYIVKGQCPEKFPELTIQTKDGFDITLTSKAIFSQTSSQTCELNIRPGSNSDGIITIGTPLLVDNSVILDFELNTFQLGKTSFTERNNPNQKHSNSTGIIIAVVVIAALIALAVIGFIIYKKRQAKKPRYQMSDSNPMLYDGITAGNQEGAGQGYDGITAGNEEVADAN